MTTAIVTGVTGQDGAYLAQLLLAKVYQVYGACRRTASANFWRLDELGAREHGNFRLVEFDLTDLGTGLRLLQQTGATEVYNLAAQSFVAVSFEQPATTGKIPVWGRLTCWRRHVSSTHEGFGLPVLEAMACGVPVVCSDASTLPEVAGSAAAFHAPGDVEGLSGLLAQGLQDDDWRSWAKAAGLARAAKFSWQRCVEQTIQVYEEITRA